MCNVGRRIVSAFTLRYRPVPPGSSIRALEDRARRDGFRVTWRHHAELDRTYALVEGIAPNAFADAPAGAIAFDTPIIALALRPNVAEALPELESALGGSGAPAGMRGCERQGERLIIEWDHETTATAVVLALAGVELARLHATSVNELLSPVPLAWWTEIAGAGLQTSDIAPNRVLEALLEEHDVAP